MRRGGTLVVSRAVKLFPHIKMRLEELGFLNIDITGEEKDSLNMVINEKQPKLVLVGSSFYQAGTPLMMGQLLKLFPGLNIAAVNLWNFPDDLAVYFIWRGVKSYLNILEGFEEFHQGLQEVRIGGRYISPAVRRLMNGFPEWPKTAADISNRQMEVLLMICNGFKPASIGKSLQVCRATVNYHLKELYNVFHVKNREELIKTAFTLKLVTDEDLVFYDRERKTEPLPESAVVKQKVNRLGRY